MSSTLRWFKSSYSNPSGGDCIEVACEWRKSSYSPSGGADCVEVATCPHAIHVRDSKNLGPAFAVAPTAWADFAGWAAR
ncbi:MULTISPECIES: DUF397 domain-containing protein [Streptomyces]|uniref:DUF397 domain-containing protein n=1 Tax=Streptomyces TaxID=1883 RepID=UPI001BDD9B98|nr:DUF397 domain-containing protein [Streptomyces sp. CJ_13]MBT1184208.1 DUF397 domain-containing protein [Streptomyces sp. CJ_13]